MGTIYGLIKTHFYYVYDPCTCEKGLIVGNTLYIYMCVCVCVCLPHLSPWLYFHIYEKVTQQVFGSVAGD